MKQNVTGRAIGVFAALGLAVALACSDSSPSGPLRRTSDAGTGGSLTSDTAAQTGGTGGSPHDTGGPGNPAPPKPVVAFTLIIHAGTQHPGAADTLQTDPLAGATISVAERGYVVTPGNGQDTLTFTEKVVATGTTDANGDISFPNLKGASTYVVKSAPPAGLALSAPTVIIPNAYSETVRTTLVFRKP